MTTSLNKPGLCRPPAAAGQRGLTLIELLLSMTLAAVAMVLIGTGVQAVAASWHIQSQRLQHQDQLSRGLALIRRDIGSAQRIATRTGDRVSYHFEGARNTLTFVAVARLRERGYALAYVNYRIEREGAAFRIVRRSSPFIAGAPAGRPRLGEAAVILTGLSGARFAFASASPDAPWLDRWTGAATMPRRVKIHAASVEGHALPPIEIAIAADAEQACVITRSTPCSLAFERTPAASRASTTESAPR